MVNCAAGITINALDMESMVTLAPRPEDLSGNLTLENEIVHALSKQINVNDILDLTDIVTNTYHDVSSNIHLYAKEISSELRSTFDLFTSKDVHDGTFALSSQFTTSDVSNNDINTFDIGQGSCHQYKSIQILQPSNPTYDSTIEILTTDNYEEFLDQNGDFGATFDADASNNNYIRALNSKFNTIDNSSPMFVEEHIEFNTTYAMGQNPISYYTVDTSNGAIPVVNTLDASCQLILNGFDVSLKASGLENFSIEDRGVYRIQQFPDVPRVTMTQFVGDSSSNFIDPSILPFFNSTKGMDGFINSIPEDNLLLVEFKSIFGPGEVINPDWKFSMNVENTANSGYALSEDMTHRIETTEIFSLDDSDLQDNDTYMRDYVRGNHDLLFNDASLRVLVGNNGRQQNLDLFTLSTGRETIPAGLFHDGQIKLNKRSVDTRVNIIERTVNTEEQLSALVYYNDEDAHGKNGISEELKTNRYVKYLQQLVHKNPAYDIAYAIYNGASINLCKETYNVGEGSTVINSAFQNDHIQFQSFTPPSDDNIEIFKINTQKQLASINGLKDNDTNEKIPSFTTTAILKNLSSLVDVNNVINSAKINFNLKPLSDISLTTDASSSGWITSSLSGQILSSSSIRAYGEDENVWPTMEETKTLLNNANDSSGIYYKFEISTLQTGTNLARLSDKITINWGENNDSMSNSITIPQASLTKTHLDSTIYNYPVASTDYYKSGMLNSLDIVLNKTIATRTFQYEFDALLRPYVGLYIKTPTLVSTTTYYTIKDNNTNEIYNNSYLSLLGLTAGSNLSPTTDFKSITETMATYYQGDEINFTGILTKSDLQELQCNVTGYTDNSGNPINLTNDYNISAHYGIPITMELNAIYEHVPVSGDIYLSMESNQISNLTGEEEYALLNSQNGYYLQLDSNKYNSNYSVDYFSSLYANLGLDANTDIGNDTSKYLTVHNNYANITNWDNTKYIINVTYETNEGEEDYSTTVLNLMNVDTSDNECTIKMSDFRFLNTQAFISRGNKDAYRYVKWIGYDIDNATENKSEQFIGVNYEYNQTGIDTPYAGIVSLDVGVYVTKLNDLGSPSSDFNTITTHGLIFEFELLQDKISVNMINNVSDDSLHEIQLDSNTNSIESFYENGDVISRILTLDRYRGFYGQQETVQVYTIQRDQLTATFRVNSSGNNISQSFNVYADTEQTIDSLIYSNSSSVGSGTIGLKINFAHSMLASDDDTLHQIYTKGDDFDISIVNPNVAGYIHRSYDGTLKDYSIFSFEGSNFSSTGGPLLIKSSRLKVKNTSLNFENVNYTLELLPSLIKVYHNSNYLGDPLIMLDLDPYIVPVNWDESISTVSFIESITIGVDIADCWNIKRNASANHLPSVSYFVLAPPYHKFTQRANVICEQMPYDPSLNTIENNAKSYMPVVNGNIYNPFFTREFTYIGEIEVSDSIIFSSLKTNDITVNHHNDRLPYLYSSAPNAEKRNFYVEGNFYTINLWLGLKNSSAYDAAVIADTAATAAYNVAKQAYDADVANFLYTDTIRLAYETASEIAIAAKSAIPTNTTPYQNLVFKLFEGCSNDLLDLNSNLNYLQFDHVVDTNAGVVMNLLQPSSPYDISGNDIFATNSNPLPPNIKFQIDSFFLTGLTHENTTNKLNLPTSSGQKVTLYTRKLQINETTGAASINVYKYIPLSIVDHPGSGIDLKQQVDILLYQTRLVKTILVPTLSIAPSSIPNWSDLLKSIPKSDIPLEWTNDATFNEITHVGLSNLNTNAIKKIPPLLFDSKSDNSIKVTYVSRKPLFQFLNKIGMPVMEIDYDGNIKSDVVSSRTLVLNSRLNSIPNNLLTNYSLLSVLGFVNKTEN
jgi:hypothetical protein